jgi:Rrf2 family cysteine metabolism transcriptional repressor
MKLSTRVRYGIRAMIELAKHPQGEVVSLNDLARNQKISHKYLESMMTTLKIAGLIESVRGKLGGYRLTRPADQICLWDIYSILDTSSELIECLKQCTDQKNACPRLGECVARETWLEFNEIIVSFLKSKNIHDLSRKELKLQAQKSS